MKPSQKKDMAAFTLTEVLVVAGLSGMILAFVVPFIQTAYNQYKQVKRSHNIIDESHLVLRSIDCKNTTELLTNRTCPTGTASEISLKNLYNQTILNTPEKNIGDARLRAMCIYEDFVNKITLQYNVDTTGGTWKNFSQSQKICPSRRIIFDYSMFTQGATYFGGMVFSGRGGSCDSVQTPLCFLGSDGSRYGRVRYDGVNHIHVRRFCQSIGGLYVSGTGISSVVSVGLHYLVEWISTGAGGWKITYPVGGELFHDRFECSLE